MVARQGSHRKRQIGSHRHPASVGKESGPARSEAAVGELDREWLGRYASLEAFALEVVAPLVRSEGRWLLECLDLARVLRALEGDDRLRMERGWVVFERIRGAVGEGGQS